MSFLEGLPFRYVLPNWRKYGKLMWAMFIFLFADWTRNMERLIRFFWNVTLVSSFPFLTIESFRSNIKFEHEADSSHTVLVWQRKAYSWYRRQFTDWNWILINETLCQRATNLFLLHTCVKERFSLKIWVVILLRYLWEFRRKFEVVRTKLIYENRIFQNGKFWVLKYNSFPP